MSLDEEMKVVREKAKSRRLLIECEFEESVNYLDTKGYRLDNFSNNRNRFQMIRRAR